LMRWIYFSVIDHNNLSKNPSAVINP